MRVGSFPGSPGATAATDSLLDSAPDANKIPGAQVKAWATHADIVDALIDLNCPSVLL